MSQYDVQTARSRWRTAAYLIASLPAFPLPALAAPSERTYVLASGSAQGVYLPLAQDIAAVARKAGIEITVVPSLGSRQNLTWLAEGRVDLALAQSDAAFDAYHGRGGFPRANTGIRAISPLYTEAIHILVRRPLYIHRMDELRGKRVCVGPAGSGTEANAAAVLEAAGLTLKEVDARHLPVEESLAALRRGEIDAVFLTSGVPSAAVTGVLADGTASLLEPDPDLVDRLKGACPFFLTKNIERTDYPRLSEQVTTIGVKALLLGRSDLDSATVDRVVRALSASQALRKKYHLADDSEAAEGVAVPTFAVAASFYAIRGLMHRYFLVLGILLAAAAAFAVVYFRAHLGRFFKRGRATWGVVYFILVWLCGSVALYLTEHRLNGNYSTIWKSMWSGLITIYSLSSKEPFTLSGRVIAVAIFILGLGGIVWATEKIFSTYLEKKIIPLLRGSFSRMHKMKDHYVIAGWNKKGPGILEQLHGDDLDDRRLIALLAEEEEAKEFEHSQRQVVVEKGSRWSEDGLRRVAVQAARSVILLADEEDPMSDARTILAILAVRKICSEQKSPRQVPVIAEIDDPKNVSLAHFAGEAGGGTLEIVSAAELGQGLLTQAAVHPGLSNVYRKLLTFQTNNSEIHRTTVPEQFVGASFDALARWTADQRSQGHEVIPIGIQRGAELFVNPASTSKPGQPGKLERGDVLFALCDSPRDLRKLYHTAAAD